jgi:pre-mRNA-processing factor SLU7
LERRRKRKEEELNKFMTEPDADQSRYPHGSDATGGVKKTETLVDTDSDSDSENDGEKAEFLENGETALQVKKDPKTRTTMRNLRIREDTAKYLKNLDPNSAFYDPKSRSMKENPTPNKVRTNPIIYFLI